MPEISRFYGIIIYMYYNEHNPPHFHFSFGEYKGVMYIKTGIIEGKIPAKVIKKIIAWAEIHEKNLLKTWDLLQEGKRITRIKPLK